MKKLWKKFDKLSSDCYTNMILPTMDTEVWDAAFSVLLDIIDTGRSQNPGFAPELYYLDEVTDYRHDVEGWLEDYLGELGMRHQYDKIRQVGNTLLKLFQWQEEDSSEIRFEIADAMRAQGEELEALAFTEAWYQAEPENILAAVTLVYSRIAVGDLIGAEQILDKYLSEDTLCTDENDIIFTAAELLYKTNGNKKAEKRIRLAIETYEKELEAAMTEWDGEELDFSEEDLPFN